MYGDVQTHDTPTLLPMAKPTLIAENYFIVLNNNKGKEHEDK